jgi:hypothetical protein
MVRFPARTRYFSCPTVSRMALETTQPPLQLVLGALSLEVKQSGRAVHLHLVPRSRIVYLHSSICLYGVPNSIRTEATLSSLFETVTWVHASNDVKEKNIINRWTIACGYLHVTISWSVGLNNNFIPSNRTGTFWNSNLKGVYENARTFGRMFGIMGLCQ